VLIENVAILDVLSGAIDEGRTLDVDGDRIRWISDAGEARGPRPGEVVVDGRGLTALPGLIDFHVHLAHDGEADWMRRPPRTPAEETLGVIRNAAVALAAGVTTVRDCGSGPARAPLAVALSSPGDEVLLPRVVSCGSPITMTGGHLHWEAVQADGVEEVRKAVRAELKAGAQWIKVMATGGVLTPGTNVGAESYTREEIAAAVSEAGRGGKRVAAHAIGNTGIKNALAAGVSSIEHGSYLDAPAIELMVERNVYHVPTLSAYHHVVSNGIEAGIPAESVSKAHAAHDTNLASFAASLAAGVAIVAGTDAGTPFNPHGGLAFELELMVRGGATPLEAIRAATVNAAAALELTHEIGYAGIGKAADLVLVEGDPLDDISRLGQPAMVIKSGRIALSLLSEASTVHGVGLRVGTA
jgi:imidazolonepropionase-like amidohydrolase